MEEKERKEKLKAGKEKLAQFQKKKKKKKKNSDADVEVLSRDSDLTVGGEVLGYSTQLGAEFIYDSDNQSVSSCSEEESEGNEEPTSKQAIRIRKELQQKCDRVEELEELLVGKQLALDKVLKENAELQKLSTNLGNQTSEEDAMEKISEDGDHHNTKNKVVEREGGLGVVKYPEFDPTEVQDLIQQVQWLQLQLKQAGNTLLSQNEKQASTVNALQKAKSEILNLQENIIQKDSIVKELAKNLKIISNECKELKESKKNQTDTEQNKEKTLNDDIVRLQLDKEAVEIKFKTLEQDLTLSSKENQDLKKLNEGLESKLESIEKSSESIVSDLKTRILTLEEENKSLHRDKESSVHFESKLKSEISVLNEKIDQFENMKKDYEQSQVNTISENERLLIDNNALSEEVVNLKEDNSMYQTQISNYENKITQAEESIEENLSLRIQNDDLNNKINNQKDVIASLRSSVTAFTTENVKLMEQLENVSSSFSLQNVEMEAVKSERDNLLLLSDKRGQVLLEFQKENDHYKALNISLEDEISTLKLRLSTTELENDTLLQEKMAFQKEMHKQMTQVDRETVIVPDEILPQVEEVYQAQSVSKHYAEPNVEECVHEHVNSQIIDNVIPLPDVPKIEPDYPTGAYVHELSNVDNVLVLKSTYAKHDPDTSSEPSKDKDSDIEDQVEQLDNDTAYQSQSFCGGSDNGNMKYSLLCGNDPSDTSKSLQQKTDECEQLKAVIQNLQTQIRRLTLDQPDSLDMFSVSYPIDYGQDVKESSQPNQELETLQTQYETQLEGLRTEIGGRRRSQDDDDPRTGGADGLREKYQQVTDELGKNLKGDQKEKLDNLVADMDKNYQQQLDNMHQQHVDDVDEQVKAMRSTLEEIYNGQLDLVRSELEQTHQLTLAELQEKLDKEHKEEVNKIVQEWQGRLDDLQQDYDREVRDTIHGDSIGNEDSATFIATLNRRLTEEHRQILQKIEAELETKSPVRHSTKDSQTDSDTARLTSEPITNTEIQKAKDNQPVLSKAQDVKKSLETQCEEIAALRAQMLGEYEQLLTVRAEVMSSQSEEVEKLQREMALIQQQYEDQMRSFQTKVQEQTETTLSATHAKELDEMKQYYETRVSEMEMNYTTDINKLKAEHAELLSRLHGESKAPIKSSPTSTPEKQREYVRKTTTLTVISDEEDENDSETSPSTEKLNTKIKALEDKLKEREKVVDSLKKRLEAEATSAEDLHGRLLDNSKTLIDYEDNLKDKMTEIEELKAALLGKDDKISQLEKEKAALEEQGEKEPPKDRSDNEIIEELKEKIKSLENELSASKETNARIKDELNKLDAQHGEAIMQLKEEMEKLNQIKFDELQQSFQIQLEEELKQQCDDLETKFKEESDRYREELEIYKKSESELKEKLSEIQITHEKQLSELQEKVSAKELTGESSSSTLQSEPKVISFSDTSELDKDSLEAAIRENVRTEILEEYEQSIDKLKSEYEERISDLNTKIQTYESQESEKSRFVDQSKELDSKELEIREMLRKELAQEYKDKLQLVIDDYENRLKQYQAISDESDIPVATSEQSQAKRAVNRSKSLDLESVQSGSKPVSKIPKEYEGYVSGIRKDYEDKISALQTQIAQYRSSSASNVSSTPMSPVSPKEVIIIEKASGDSQDMQAVTPSPDAGSEIPVKLKSQGDQQSEIDQNISELGSLDSSSMKLDYNKQIELMSKEIAALKESSGHVSREELETQIREEIDADYKEKIDELTKTLESAKAEKTSAEQKVKADMFVWHEEVVAQLKRKHEQTISQLHKEYEEKMDLLREELQEEFDAEKTKLAKEHKLELADVEEKYDNLVEGLRTGEVPEVAQIVQDKYDMELEMAKTLIQQECDETIESEQSRISDEYEKKMKEMLNEKEKELEEQKVYYEKLLADQKVYYEKELVDQRNSLLQQYESQIIELKSKHEAELADIKDEFENRVEAIRAETMEIETRTTRASLSPQKSVSEESERGKKDEESEVTSTTGSGKPDKDGDDDDGDDDSDAGKGGAESGATSEPIQKEHENKQGAGDSAQDEDKDDATDGRQEVQEELIVQQVRAPSLESSVQSFDMSEEESDLVKQLRKDLADKIQHYESLITELKAIQKEEIKQLTTELEEKEDEYTKKLKIMEEKHDLEVKDYMETIQKLREGETDEDDSEAMEMAHQEEMKGLENRLVLKHKHGIENLGKQHQSKMDDMAEKHKTVVEDLQKQLHEAQRLLDQYHDVQSPVQTVPTFHGDSMLGSTKESEEDFMVPSKSSASEQTASQVQTPRSEQGSDMGTMETQVFEARDAIEDATPPGSPDRTLEDIGVQSLETSMDRSRGSLRGVDDTQETDMIEFSEEESDKSIEEAGVTGKTDRSTPTALMQTLHLGADVPGGPTVKSLDDTTDSSFRVSDREDLVGRIKELETEVEDLRRKLDYELTKQEDHHDRLDREQQEEGNLVSMLRADIDRLNGDRESYQSTNEHLLGLLSDAVKTYMGVEERISKRLKTLMEKPAAEKPADKSSQATDECKKSPTPQKLSPIPSPGRISPARPEDPENPQETSILSNITDEGLDLSQRISDSIFQGPELAAEEEELLTDAGHRLQTSVGRLLDMIEESTSQLLDTKQTQSELMEQLDMKGTGLEQMTARCNDLEERLKEESERKDFLALELHKAEGLIEGYTSERELQEEKVRDLEEQKETLVLELETTKSKLHDLVGTHSEVQELKRRLAEQEEMLKRNVGEEAQALMLEVSRLSSENREKDSKIQQVHDKYESRVRELENSGEDMEHHYSKLLDERKQDMADMKLQVDALEKQVKSKKQFIEEQSAEREQEHEDYQKELAKWKQMVQDLEKHHGSETNLHKEVEELSEQLMTRIDQHNEALLESEKWQRTVKERETQIQDLKAVIQSTEQELQEKTDEIEQVKQKVTKLEEELSRRPLPDDDLTDSVKSDGSAPKTKDSSDLEQTMEHYRERLMTQLTVEEELRQAAHRTKEELVREKHALQTQVNENLVQISALRNKLDEMRHRRDLSDPSDLAKRLDVEREKAEEKDQQISDLKLEVERLTDTIERKENEVAQLREKDRTKRSSPIEGLEYESDKEIERQMENLKRENRKLKDKLRLAEAGTVTDMSGLSQELIDEKNQEIDLLSEQVFRLQTEFNELKAEKGVEGVYEELDSLKEELRLKETELTGLQSVQVSQTFTDHSLTPDSSIMNVRASFADKTSIQQEMEEFEANRQEKMASLESEVTTLQAALEDKQAQIASLQNKFDELSEQVKHQDTEDENILQEILHEKEEMVTQLTVQIEGLQSEVDNLTEFQTKLQEDFDTVQTMLEEKEREIESLNKELESSSVDREQHSLVIKHEVEIARLKKDLREKDNVVEEKLEELAEMVDKVELLESQISKYISQEADYDKQIVAKDRQIVQLRKEIDSPFSAEEKDEIIRQKTDETEMLKKEIQSLTSARPSTSPGSSISLSGRPSTSLSEEEKSLLIDEQAMEIKSLKNNIEELLGRPPSPTTEEEKSVLIKKQREEIEHLKQQVDLALEGKSPSSTLSEEIKSDVIQRLKREIERLKQQIMDSNLSEDDKSALIRQLRLENETFRRQVDAALKIKPPSPPMDEDEKSEMIHKQKEEISSLKNQLEASLTIRPPSPPRTDDEKSVLIEEQKEEILNLRKQIKSALQVTQPLALMSDEEKDKTIELRRAEVAELRSEMNKVTQALHSGEEGQLMKDKIEEVVTLKTELNLVKQKLESPSLSSIESMKSTIKEKDKKLIQAEEKVKQLEEDLESLKEVKAYEDEIQFQEKDDEIEELKAELEGYRSRAESSTIAQSIDIEVPTSDTGTLEPKELVRSMSFYKDQYEEKCSENRKLQVDLDLVKQQLERARSDKLEDAQEEIELFKAELERKNVMQVDSLKERKDILEKENIELKQQLSMTADERITSLESQVEAAKAEASKERMDSVQAIKDLEQIRDRKEKERKTSLQTIHSLEEDIEGKAEVEKELRNQVKTLTEELTVIKRQYGIEEDHSKDSIRPLSKLSSFRSESTDSFELGTDVETLQEQVMQFKKQADKAKETLTEKQKYQSQVVKLEIQYENLQKQMKREVGLMEEQLKSSRANSEQDVWAQLQATQDRLEKTTDQLAETGHRLSEAESKLQEVSKELFNRESDMKDLQQDLWKTSGQLSVTSGKLQETEEKLRLTVAQVTEREDQIHQLQGELQHTQQEVEKAEQKSKTSVDRTEEVKYLEERLKKTEAELEEVQKSLKESVQMSEQQLQMVETKDEEYVKLKLDIQQTMASKDKLIRDQKQKIKDAEEEVQEVRLKMEEMERSKEKDILRMKEDSTKLQEQSSKLHYQIDKLNEELNRPGREAERESPTLVALRTQLQKVMNLKDELSNQHQRHVEELTTRAQQDTESQLAALRIKCNDEIEHLKSNHARELENKLQDLRHNLERKHKKDTNKLIVKHQEEVSLLKARGSDTGSVGRGDGVGQERSTMVNGHREPIPGRLQGILQRLHTEGVQVLTISELETLRRSQTQSVLPQSADIESLQTGWENERQSYLSTIQSLKDLLSQTNKLQGLEKGAEGSDWRAELLRAIAYVFTKERESLLAELRSHVLSHPNTSFDEIQRLEHKIRTMESHHQDSMDQIFNADRQSMLAEIRDLHAHATIARMHNHEERTKATERLQDTEDQAMKKERQLKRQVQLLEFKIQQEKILQDDLRTSLDAERTRSTELSTQLNEEKTGTYDLQTTVSALQMQCGKLKESLEREQSRYVSVTNALEEEKSKSLNLSELLESERQTLWRVQSELEAIRQQQSDVDMALVEQLQGELEQEREKRAQAESFMEMDRVALENLRQEVEMEKRRQIAIETELSAKITNMHKIIDAEKQRGSELDIALERERNLSHHLRQKLEAEKSNSEELTGRERALIDDLNTQLENQRSENEDLNRALQQEQRTRENVSSAADSEKRLLKDHLDQERSMNNDLKREVDQLQFDRLEAVNKLQKEREAVQRLKMEQDRVNEEIRKLRNLELQRDQDRDSERHSDRDKVRQADREKEDFKMKLHEQVIETQRLTQKVARLEEELSDSREKELRAIRDLEHERVRRSSPAPEMISVQTSPRLDTQDLTSAESMAEQRERWHVYRSQLESMCQSLHYLVLRCRDQLGKATHGGPRHGDVSDLDVLQTSLHDLLSEVKQLQEMESDFMSHPSSSVNERILRQNEELTGFVARMGEEKTELRNALTQLEEEIWQYRQMDAKYQDMQRNSEHADHIIVSERAEWAKEKLSLQMALNAAEREIDLLQTDLRVERERRVAAGMTETTESDKIKIQRLYGKYLRAESFRKGLVYQKKYLLVLLGGFQDTEETTLALLSRMGAVDQYSLRRIKPKPLTMFRGAVRVVIAISRMRYLVKKWRRATRVGSEVVGGAVDQTNGYMPQSSSYSPPRHGTSPRYSSAPIRSSSSPPHAMTYRHQSPLRSSDPSSTYGSQSSHFDVDPYSAYAYQPRLGTSRMPSTPPKKDYSSTTKYTSPSSGARRKILTSASIPAPTSRVRFSSDTSNNGTLGDPDEYINRLENLQSRLGSLQSALQEISHDGKAGSGLYVR